MLTEVWLDWQSGRRVCYVLDSRVSASVLLSFQTTLVDNVYIIMIVIYREAFRLFYDLFQFKHGGLATSL